MRLDICAVGVSLLFLLSTIARADDRACELISKSEAEMALGQQILAPEDVTPTVIVGAVYSLDMSACAYSVSERYADPHFDVGISFPPFEPFGSIDRIRAYHSPVRDIQGLGTTAFWEFYGGPFSDPNATPGGRLFVFADAYILDIGVRSISNEDSSLALALFIANRALPRISERIAPRKR
jgi:hypothetical protein